MALIKCPTCGNEVSEKASKCVHCGYEFFSQTRLCEECGKEVPLDATECPNCGCPLEPMCNSDKPQQVEVASIKVAKKTKKVVIGFIVAILLCLVGGIAFKTYSETKKEEEYRNAYNKYIDNLEQVQFLMLSGGSDAESLCNLTLRVWHNAIYEVWDEETDKYTRTKFDFVDDFNEALDNLFSDTKTMITIQNIEDNQSSVKTIIKKLQTTPEGLDKCYDTVSDLYEAYKSLTDLAIKPTGNYTSFGEKKNQAVSDFMSAYEKLDNQIPDRLTAE